MTRDKQFLGLIESIYDSALEPKSWIRTLRSLAEAVDGESSVLILLDEYGLQTHLSAADRLNPSDMQVYAEYYADKDLALQAAAAVPVGKPFTVPMVVSERRYLASEHFNDFLVPMDIRHIACMQLLRGKAGIGYLSIFRPGRRENFGDDELRLMRVLSPHIRRALDLALRLGRLETEAEWSAAALDRVPSAVFMVDGEGRLLFTNTMGEALLNERDGLYLQGGQLSASSTGITGELKRRIAGAARAAMGAGAEAGGVLSLGRPSSRRPLAALVSPLHPRHTNLAARAGLALLFVSDPEAELAPPAQMLGALYGLTPAEARLAAALAGGATLSDYAEEAAITMNTARWTLKQVFQKTETRTQGALIRLLLNTLPVSPR